MNIVNEAVAPIQQISTDENHAILSQQEWLIAEYECLNVFCKCEWNEKITSINIRNEFR